MQVLAKTDDLDLEALPSDARRRELAAVGIERARHRAGRALPWLVGSQTALEKARRSIASLADRQHSGDQLEVVDYDGAYDSGLRVCGEALELDRDSRRLRMKALSVFDSVMRAQRLMD